MALITVLTRDVKVRQAVRDALADVHTVAVTRSVERLEWLIRERPSTVAVLDSTALPAEVQPAVAVGELRRRYPSVAFLLIVRTGADPLSLFRLGRAGLRNLVLLPVDALVDELRPALGRALATGTTAMVTRAVSPYLPLRETRAVRLALEGVQRGWSTEELSTQAGLTRPHLSVRLKDVGMPSAGHLLIWAKLLHAGRWLTDPGRSAESVSRQLEYSSGAAFRRALHGYVHATPTEVREAGGLSYVLGHFLDACDLHDSVVGDRSVA